jgi:hypothetical protein
MSNQEDKGSLGGSTIAVIIMAALAVLGVGAVFLIRHKQKSRHPIPHPVAAVPNPAFHINMDDRARTGNVVVTTTTDQIQYLIPMTEQAPGEYLEAVTRNEDYTYAPPMQPPADYAVIDESLDNANGNPGNVGGRAGSKRKSGGGNDLDLNGYVLDESNVPGNLDGAGKAADGGRRIGNTVHGTRDAAGNTVYSSYVEGSTGGASNAAEYGTPAEYGGTVEAVYGDDPYGAVGIGAGSGIQRHSDARQGSVYTGFEGMDHDTEETDI